MLRCVPLGDETERLRVGIALEEALSNALFHGNLELSSNNSHLDRKQYEQLAQDRFMQVPYCDRKIHVRVCISPSEAMFVIGDDGPGFEASIWNDDHAALLTDRSYGRGILLMRSIMDDVSYNEKGNEVTLVKRCIGMDDDAICVD